MDERVDRLLNQVENKELVLPEFQREFTWNKTQSKELIGSFLKDYPTGALLFWKTKEKIALKNMPDFDFEDRVEVILDGQQRLTTLYLLIKNSIPPYYTQKDIEKDKDIRNLYYNLATGQLKYYMKKEMENKPVWVKVIDCFKDGKIDAFDITDKVVEEEGQFKKTVKKLQLNLDKIRNIKSKNYPIIYVEESSTLKEALIVFDRVNSAGTPLSQADIALAHMCSCWPDTRRIFKEEIEELKSQNFEFDLKFLVRGMNAVVNHRAEYKQLHDNTEEELKKGFKKLSKILDYLINVLRDRAYIYSTEDLNTQNILIPIVGYLSMHGPEFQDEASLKKALYWMYAALYQRRYAGSVDQKLEEDLNCLRRDYTPDTPPLQDLIDVLKEDAGDPEIVKTNVNSRGVNHPLYNMMNIVIRSKEGVDWAKGISLAKPYGKQYQVERHHIFPRSILEKNGYDTRNLFHNRLVHEIANRVPLTKKGNREIFDKKPIKYLPIVEKKFPGVLNKFFIPENKELWKLENYKAFLEKRRELIAEGINSFMKSLLKEEDEEIRDKSIQEIIEKGEGEKIEFKASLRWNLYTENYDKKLEKPTLKNICGFLNNKGGCLLIGVKDDGEIFGIEKDLEQLKNADKFQLHISNIISQNIGDGYLPYIKIEFENIEGKTVCVIKVDKGVKPAYCRYDSREKFYVRLGNFTKELSLSEATDYIKEKW